MKINEPIVVGTKSRFAVETCVSAVFPENRNSLLGYFVIHILGQRYGVYEPDASMLGNSIDVVLSLIENEGFHKLSIAKDFPAETFVRWYMRCFSEYDTPEQRMLGNTGSNLWDEFKRNEILWAPDGDEAFDDGSHVFVLDYESTVRLIGCTYRDYQPIEGTVESVMLERSEFYGILRQWLPLIES